ncbi:MULTISPECIES: hypothetical protein [Paenibacillus]|uniref:hypothetical protein n=1 Tax=Paenibacillus TaxID=44249 RepID=UPI00209FEE7F|nr:hypothetical protein [Paenibacillus xylanexedens]MCP1422282.1 hypothetical protein [Paenibacillus xylanexedens]
MVAWWGGSFILDGEANVRAGLLQQECSNKAPVHVADLPAEPEPPLMPIEEYEAAQAAAAAEAAGVTQASTTNPKDGSLAGAALAITAMIPILGALGGIAAQTAIGVGIAAVATGLIASVPKIGSFKPSALNLLDRFTNGFAELQQQENEAKWTMLGKMLTAAKELTTSTSVTDFFKKLEQQNKEISLAYEQIPSYFREKWAHEKAQRDLQVSLEFFKSVEKDDVQHQTFFSPYYQEISWALDRAGIYHNITVEEVKDYDFWLRQDLTLEQMKYLTQLIYNPISDEKFVEMIYDYEMHRDLIENGTMIGGNLRVRTPDIEGKVMQVVGNGLKTAATFAKKKWTDGQKMRIVSGGGSDWSGDKSKKTGQASSGGKTEAETETSPNSGNPPKTAAESSKQTVKTGSSGNNKPANSKPSSSSTGTKQNGSSTKLKDARTKPESSNSVNNKTPNEVNTWKPSTTTKKDEGSPSEQTKKPNDTKEPNTNDNLKKKKGKSQKQIQQELDDLDQKIKIKEKVGASEEEIKKLKRERSKLANQLDTPDDISSKFDLSGVEGYERKIDNKKYYDHDKGDFGEEVAKKIAINNNLGKDISDQFQVGRNGIDGAFLSKGPPPKLTMIEAKTSEWGNFNYPTEQKLGGPKYFEVMSSRKNKSFSVFQEKLQKLIDDYPGLKFDYIRVEVDISKTSVGFGVDVVKVKDWSKEIN